MAVVRWAATPGRMTWNRAVIASQLIEAGLEQASKPCVGDVGRIGDDEHGLFLARHKNAPDELPRAEQPEGCSYKMAGIARLAAVVTASH